MTQPELFKNISDLQKIQVKKVEVKERLCDSCGKETLEKIEGTGYKFVCNTCHQLYIA